MDGEWQRVLREASHSEEAAVQLQGELEAKEGDLEDVVMLVRTLREHQETSKAKAKAKAAGKVPGTSDAGPSKLVARMGLGHSIFGQVRIDDPGTIALDIGAGIFVDLSLDEADKVLERLLAEVRKELEASFVLRAQAQGKLRVVQDAADAFRLVSGGSNHLF